MGGGNYLYSQGIEEGRTSDYFLGDNDRVFYHYRSWQDISSENANFAEYGYVNSIEEYVNAPQELIIFLKEKTKNENIV